MATIREKAPYQWQAQIRRKGWPNQNATFRTKKDAEAWGNVNGERMWYALHGYDIHAQPTARGMFGQHPTPEADQGSVAGG